MIIEEHYNEYNHLPLFLPRSRTRTVWFYTSTSNKRAARPTLYTESLTRDLKLMYRRFTLVRISINLNSSQLNMFREIILPIFRSTRLFITASGTMHPRCCRSVAGQQPPDLAPRLRKASSHLQAFITIMASARTLLSYFFSRGHL